MRSKVDELVEALARGVDAGEILTALQLTAAEAVRLLKTKRARRQLLSRRRLAEIHAVLIAGRFGPYAVQQLCKLLEDEKAEVRLKGATAILKVAGVSGRRRAGKRGAPDGAPGEGVATAEDVEAALKLWGFTPKDGKD